MAQIVFGLGIFILALSNISCIFDSNDCICTTEFREYRVLIIDRNGQPIDSLKTRTINSKGEVMLMTDSCASLDWSCKTGEHIVLTDGFEKQLSSFGENVTFHAYNRTVDLNAKYLFSTDPCMCHVQKLYGPDTLVAP